LNKVIGQLPKETGPKTAYNNPYVLDDHTLSTLPEKKNGGNESPSPTQSGSQLPEETATDFLAKDIDANDFVSKAVANTDVFFPETAIKRRNQEIAQQTKIDVFSNPTKLAQYTADRVYNAKGQTKIAGNAKGPTCFFGRAGRRRGIWRILRTKHYKRS
jgi:hypothetical protein